MSGEAQDSGKQSDTLLWLAAAVVAGVGVTWLVLSKPWSSSAAAPIVASLAAPAPSASPAPAPGNAQAGLDSSLDDDPLRMARLAHDAGMLIEPEGYSAWALYHRALQREPDNAEAEQGLRTIAEELLRRANAALEQGRFADAKAAVDRIRTAIPVHPGANDLAFRITELAPRAMPPQAPVRPSTPTPSAAERQVTREAEPENNATVAQVPVDPTLVPHQGFTTALAQNRLLTPVDASAKHFLGLLTSIDADHELTKQARALLFSQLASRAQQAIAALDTEAASTWIDEAALLGVDRPAVDALRQTLRDRMIEVESARRVPASALTIVEYVSPVYPARALDRALNGWVDLEFTVSRDGVTKDVEVVDASHSNYFREEASRAVSAWRFEPRVYMDETIEQRAHTRIRFRLQ